MMSTYSEQDLRYAAELREEIHQEALAIVRKTHPGVTQVVDCHPVEDYFQEVWDYPGRWYTVVAVPYGYRSRKAFVDALVRDTLSGREPDPDADDAQERKEAAKREQNRQSQAKQPAPVNGHRKEEDDHRLTAESSIASQENKDPFYRLLDEYPDLVVDYCIVKEERYDGYASHRAALKAAFAILGREWEGDPDQAVGSPIAAEELFSSAYQRGRLTYRRAFLRPPHPNGYCGKDFERVNAALFPNGTEKLDVYEWSTDWSDYFDDGHEWWGTLCLTVYDETLRRFAVIMASATD